MSSALPQESELSASAPARVNLGAAVFVDTPRPASLLGDDCQGGCGELMTRHIYTPLELAESCDAPATVTPLGRPRNLRDDAYPHRLERRTEVGVPFGLVV